jgi:hypothetical protein
MKHTLTTISTRSEATQKVMAAKLTTLTHKIAIQLHLVAKNCTISSSRSTRPVRKLLNTPSYVLQIVCKLTLVGFGCHVGECSHLRLLTAFICWVMLCVACSRSTSTNDFAVVLRQGFKPPSPTWDNNNDTNYCNNENGTTVSKQINIIIFLQGLGQRPLPVQKFNFWT